MLYEIEASQGQQDSCVDKETLEVNLALEAISDRLEGAILGKLSKQEVSLCDCDLGLKNSCCATG